MKKYLLILLTVVLHADISAIINEIKEMESYTPKFKNMEKYDLFTNLGLKSGGKTFINTEYAIKIDAIFQNRVNINGKWYKAGDEIYGYKIIKITDEGVFLSKNGKIKKINLKSNVLKVEK
jgi:hypothetical protein